MTLAVLAGLLWLRYERASRTDAAPTEASRAEEPASVRPAETTPQADSAPTPTPAAPAETPPEPAEVPNPETAEPEAAQEPEQNETDIETSSGPYNERTYQLVTDMVFTVRNRGAEGEENVRALLAELKSEDPELGRLWEGIMDYWLPVCGDFPVNAGILPDGLPGDDSLCIVVLGFQLLYDGGMTPELIGRCETALACAEKYPNAYLAVTGGGTAYGNPSATEAGVMADWFVQRGIAPERIIVEKASLTTDQNAAYTCEILAESYPQIRELAIVSSDYHVALGSVLFQEAALLYGYRHGGEAPYRVVSNAGFATAGSPEYSDPRRFSSDIWTLADPTY